MSYSERGSIEQESLSKVEKSTLAWEKRLADLGFTVERISEYPVDLKESHLKIPDNKRPHELSGLSENLGLGEILSATLDGFRILLSPPSGEANLFAANVFNPSGKMVMSNHDYSGPEFFAILRQGIPSLQNKIPDDPAVLFTNIFA